MWNNRIAVLALAAASLLLAACENRGGSWLDWKASAPANPGSAEQLVGTVWNFGPNAIAFDADGKCRMGAKGGALAPLDGAAWTIRNGVITVTNDGRKIVTATWDGEHFVANGFVGSPAGEGPAFDDFS